VYSCTHICIEQVAIAPDFFLRFVVHDSGRSAVKRPVPDRSERIGHRRALHLSRSSRSLGAPASSTVNHWTYKQEQLQTAHLREGESERYPSPDMDPDSVSGLRSYMDDLQKLTDTSLFKVTFVVKFFVKIRSPFRGYACKLWKNVLSRNVEESSKKFLDPDPEANYFQNLTNSSLSKDT